MFTCTYFASHTTRVLVDKPHYSWHSHYSKLLLYLLFSYQPNHIPYKHVKSKHYHAIYYALSNTTARSLVHLCIRIMMKSKSQKVSARLGSAIGNYLSIDVTF